MCAFDARGIPANDIRIDRKCTISNTKQHVSKLARHCFEEFYAMWAMQLVFTNMLRKHAR